MVYRHFLSVILVLGLLAAIPLHAQETRSTSSQNGAVEVITFDEAVRLALQNSIEIRRAANAVASQQSTVSVQRSSLLPTLSMGFGGSRYNGRRFDQTVGELVSRQSTSASGSVSASVTLFDGFSSWAELSEARHTLESSEITLQHKRQQTIFNVMTRYLELIKAWEQVQIQEENLEAAQQELRQVEDQVRVGTRRSTDLYQQRSQVAAAELSMLQARRAAQDQEVQLIQELQLDPFGTYEFEIPRLDEDDIVPEQYEVAILIEEAFSHRQDLRAQEASITASEQSLRAARGSRFPTISVSASMGTGYSSVDPLYSFSDQFFRVNRSESIGLNISIPLFDGFQRRNQIRQASIQYENAQLDLQEQRQEVAAQVRQAYLDYEGMLQELEVARVRVEAAQAALEAAQQEYRVGRGTLVEATQARAEYVEAQSSLVQAQYDFIFQKRQIDYYVGALDPEQPLFE